MTNNYPENYVQQVTFPHFSKEDLEKLNTLFDTSFEEDLVLFFTENAGKVSTKTCLVVYEDGEREIQGFISNWLYHTLYEKKNEILSIEYEEDEKELKELHQNYLLLAEVNHIGTLWIGIEGKHKGKVVLLDEQRGQDINEVWDYITLLSKSLKTFQKRNLIDFEVHKNDENLFW